LGRNALPEKLNTMPIWLLLYAVYTNDFARLSKGRQPGEEIVYSHFRKGISGDWRNCFGEEHRQFFKKHHNDLLVTLGYEDDDSW
jgi:hypothetical protein